MDSNPSGPMLDMSLLLGMEGSGLFSHYYTTQDPSKGRTGPIDKGGKYDITFPNDPNMEKYGDKIPPIKGRKDKHGKDSKCPESNANRAQEAWAAVMAMIDYKISKMKAIIGGCNKDMDELLDCLMNIPKTDFSDPIPDKDHPELGLTIVCEDQAQRPDGLKPLAWWDEETKELHIDFTRIDNNVTVPGFGHNEVLQATIAHELTHSCNKTKDFLKGHSSELESKFFEAYLYGSPWPLGLNKFYSPLLGKRIDNAGTIRKLCCESERFLDSMSETEIQKFESSLKSEGVSLGSNLMLTDKLVWDTRTGRSWLRCDDGSLNELTVTDGVNPFADQSQNSDPPLDISYCTNAELGDIHKLC
ncbi:MAG: hypothetical protein WCH46_10865 [bacterium]